MEETILPMQPSFKVYKDQAIYVGTFLGGPLVAGYLAAENFKQFGQFDKVKTSWTIAVLATLIIFGGIFLIPNFDKVPNYIIPIVYTGIAQFLIKKYQSTAIKSHIDSGGQTFSIWRAVWIGLVGLIFLLAVILAILLVADKEMFQ
jgi:hypothetical protein